MSRALSLGNPNPLFITCSIDLDSSVFALLMCRLYKTHGAKDKMQFLSDHWSYLLLKKLTLSAQAGTTSLITHESILLYTYSICSSTSNSYEVLAFGCLPSEGAFYDPSLSDATIRARPRLCRTFWDTRADTDVLSLRLVPQHCSIRINTHLLV